MRLAIDRTTGRPPAAATVPGDVEVRTFVRPSPRHAAWAVAAGLVVFPQRAPAPVGPLALDPTAMDPLTLNARSARSPAPMPSAASSGAIVKVVSPEPGLRLLRDPETPAELSTLVLQAEVSPLAPQVVWYVDGAPFHTADYPYVARWPLAPGEHTFQARLPYGDLVSPSVRVTVQ